MGANHVCVKRRNLIDVNFVQFVCYIVVVVVVVVVVYHSTRVMSNS